MVLSGAIATQGGTRRERAAEKEKEKEREKARESAKDGPTKLERKGGCRRKEDDARMWGGPAAAP